jgi:hypothetical protein
MRLIIGSDCLPSYIIILGQSNKPMAYTRHHSIMDSITDLLVECLLRGSGKRVYLFLVCFMQI